VVIHLGDHLHSEQRGFLSLVCHFHESCGQPCNNDGRHSFGQEPFPVTTEIWNQDAMHELGHNKRDNPDRHRHGHYPRDRSPIYVGAYLRLAKTSHLNLQFRLAQAQCSVQSPISSALYPSMTRGVFFQNCVELLVQFMALVRIANFQAVPFHLCFAR
jgi:hypothetical protein